MKRLEASEARTARGEAVRWDDEEARGKGIVFVVIGKLEALKEFTQLKC